MRNPFEGKTSEEKKKLVLALALGVIALISVSYAIVGFFPAKRTTNKDERGQSTQKSDSRPAVSPDQNSEDDADLAYGSTEVRYSPSNYAAPDAARNIFSSLDPPIQVGPIVKIPTPTPPPPITVGMVVPQSVYVGSKSFRLEVAGEKFSAKTKIFFNGGEMPTTFVNERRLVTEVPSNFISSEGARVIKVSTIDGKLYSNEISLVVMAQPKPTFQFLGTLSRKRSNNDTAYIQEQGQQAVGRRLNDIVGGRFRLVGISSTKIIVEDVNLGFRHSVGISTTSSFGGNQQQTGPNFSSDPNYIPYNPNLPPGFNPNLGPNPTVNPNLPNGPIPGIQIPRYQPNPNQPVQPNPIPDEDDDGIGRIKN